jgi:EMAP domain
MDNSKPDNIAAADFFQFDIRAGTILTIESVPKSKKLVKLEVSFGAAGNRTILAGIASAVPDRVMVGQKVAAVLNLAPREMMGIMSHGMILATHDEEDKIWLINPGPVPDGVSIG